MPAKNGKNSDTGKVCIDNIFTNTQRYSIHSGNVLAGISDHLPQFAIFETRQETKTEQRYYQDWRSLDQKAFKDHFRNFKWKEILKLENLDPDISFDCFIKTLNTLIEQHVPMKKVSKKQSKRKPWITRGILKSILQRDKNFKRFVKERDVSEKANIFRN